MKLKVVKNYSKPNLQLVLALTHCTPWWWYIFTEISTSNVLTTYMSLMWCICWYNKKNLWQLIRTKMVKVLSPSSFGMVSFHLKHYRTNKICTSHFPPATWMRWISHKVRNSCCHKDHKKINTTTKITAILK